MSLDFNSRAVIRHCLGVLILYSLSYIAFFSPVLFSNRFLAPGDGIIYFLPNFVAARASWQPMIWGGFPAIGDAQLMLWYPPAFLFSLLGPTGYQLFIIFAYVLASAFTYGYIYSVTKSRLASAISGFVYGLCGFMVAHVGHASIVHTAAWLPLILWSLAMLQDPARRALWFMVGTLAVASGALAGHPQIFVYSVCLGAAFTLVTGLWASEVNRLHYFLTVLGVYVLGIGIAAVQLWPTAELARLSWRAALSFQEFVAYELPLRQLPMLVFPYLYGGSPASFYGLPYFGGWPSSSDGWGAGELSGYLGLLPFVLGIIGLIAERHSVQARFWFIAAVVALLLTVGEGTPLARFIYHLPVLNKFRVPARHFIELTFSMSVLAGLGVAALQKSSINRHLLQKVLIGFTVLLLLCLAALLIFNGKVNELAWQRLGHPITLRPWANSALAAPLLVFVIDGILLVWWSRSPKSRWRGAVLVAALVLDLSSFGWFYEWRYRSPYKAYLRSPIVAGSLRTELKSSQQRILPIRGGTGHVNELPPNLSTLWQFPSASGYGPFILTSISNLMTMPPHGSVDDSWRDPANQSLNLMAVRYLVLPPDKVEPPSVADAQGTKWAGNDFSVDVGPGCNPKNPITYDLDLTRVVRASSISIVGALACSVQIKDGQEVIRLTTTDEAGSSTSFPLVAGRDFSEWAIDCSDVRPSIQHKRAEIFRSYQAQRGNIKCDAHDYVARIMFASPINLRRVELAWIGPAGTFALKKMTASDETTSIPLTSNSGSLADPTRWREVVRIDAANSGYGPEVSSEDQGSAVVFENLNARPRVWLIPEVLSMSGQDIFNAVRSSHLPDGRVFDPAKLALVEAPFALNHQPDETGSAKVVSLSSTVMVVQTSTVKPAFLVTSDAFYPGWEATVDGKQSEVYQTDYALRGVALPSGTHIVRFEFKPRSFYYGSVVSLISLLLLGGYGLKVWSVPRLRALPPRDERKDEESN